MPNLRRGMPLAEPRFSHLTELMEVRINTETARDFNSRERDTLLEVADILIEEADDILDYNLDTINTYTTEAAASAAAAAGSRDNALASAINAALSADAAAVSEANAELSETAAADSAGEAETAATNASTSATNAAASASAAASSATDAQTAKTGAEASATAADSSADAASASATAAAASATAADISEANAASSASTASTQATNAANSATSASTSASTATTQASNASASATDAWTSETNAAASATAAANSATAAATSETNAEASADAAAASAADSASVRTELAATTAGDGAEMVAFLPAGTGGTARTLDDKGLELVTEADYAVVGNGVTDDSTSILNAANAAVAAGRALQLNGSKTYAVSSLSLPAGLRLLTNGATFRDVAGTAGNSPLIIVNSLCRVDELNVDVPTGVTRDRVVVITGTRPQVDGYIRVVSVDQQANTSDNDDACVRVSSATSPRIGGIYATNYDQPFQFLSSSDVRVGKVDAASYARGMQVEDCTKLKIRRGSFATTSPNASYTPGHVGVLLSSSVDDASRNIKLLDFVIEDSGEHGIRVAGPGQISNVHLVRPSIKNAGGSGIKVLGTDSGAPTARNKRIYITNPIIEDCGSGGLTSNMCGILVMYADEVHITNPIVRKQSKLQSGHTGVRFVACSDVHVTEPEVADATFDGIWLDGALGDLERIAINGGISRNNGRDGFRLSAGTNTMRRIHVDGLACDGNTGLGMNIAVGGGSMVASLFRMKLYGNTGGSGACDHTGAVLDITGTVGAITPLSGITASEGSTWRDTGGLLYTRTGNDWIGRGRVALGSAVTNNNAVANTMQDVTGLTIPVVTGRSYRFRFVVQYSADATTTGSRWSINGPTASFLQYRSEYTLTATSRTINEGLGGSYDAPAAANASSASTAARNLAIVEGTLIPSAAGSLTMRFASEVAGAAIVASANSYVEWEEVL